MQQDTEQHNVLHIRDTLEQNKGMDNQYVHHSLVKGAATNALRFIGGRVN